MATIDKKITIIGAGPTGAFMAIMLAQNGFKVDLYEAREDLRELCPTSNKSFNITLYCRAIEAFKKVGVWGDIQSWAVQVTGNTCHFKNGQELYKFKKSKKERLFTIQRNHLAKVLLDKAEAQKNVHIAFNKRCIFVDKQKRQLYLQDTQTENITKKKVGFIIGADGVNSTIRSFLQMSQNTNHKQEFTEWGYKEITLSKEMVKELNMNPKTTHTWPSKNSLIIGFPNNDGSQTLMLNLPNSGESSFSSLRIKDDVNRFFQKTLPDLSPVKSHMIRTFLQNPIGRLSTIYTAPWHYKDFIVLVGDAAHGILPFYGQGTGSAFEDCLLLTNYLRHPTLSLEEALSKYQKVRKTNTDIMAALAKENFNELKDKDASMYHIAKQKINTFIAMLLPNLWIPSQDTLIAHTTMPFEEAHQRYLKQERIARLLFINIWAFFLSIPFLLIARIKTFGENKSLI